MKRKLGWTLEGGPRSEAATLAECLEEGVDAGQSDHGDELFETHPRCSSSAASRKQRVRYSASIEYDTPFLSDSLYQMIHSKIIIVDTFSDTDVYM